MTEVWRGGAVTTCFKHAADNQTRGSAGIDKRDAHYLPLFVR